MNTYVDNAAVMNRVAIALLIVISIQTATLAVLFLAHILSFYPWYMTIRTGPVSFVAIRRTAFLASIVVIAGGDVLLSWGIARLFPAK
jgi:H+/Cl- antiporter ClcA